MFGVLVWLACLGCNHQSGVAFIVLVIYVYKGTAVKPIYNVHETFAASHHQAILLVIVSGKDQWQWECFRSFSRLELWFTGSELLALWTSLSPNHWCPAPWPPLLWPLSPELCAERLVHYRRMPGTVWMPHARLLSLARTLEAPSHRRGCCLNRTRSLTEKRHPHQGLSLGGGPLLHWPSSNSRTGEMVVYPLATSTRKLKIRE